MGIPVLKQTTAYRVEKGVPTPEPKQGAAKYPFGEMEVGDSFHFDESIHRRLCSAAHNYGKANGKKFSIRSEGSGYRCWRIA